MPPPSGGGRRRSPRDAAAKSARTTATSAGSATRHSRCRTPASSVRSATGVRSATTRRASAGRRTGPAVVGEHHRLQVRAGGGTQGPPVGDDRRLRGLVRCDDRRRRQRDRAHPPPGSGMRPGPAEVVYVQRSGPLDGERAVGPPRGQPGGRVLGAEGRQGEVHDAARVGRDEAGPFGGFDEVVRGRRVRGEPLRIGVARGDERRDVQAGLASRLRRRRGSRPRRVGRLLGSRGDPGRRHNPGRLCGRRHRLAGGPAGAPVSGPRRPSSVRSRPRPRAEPTAAPPPPSRAARAPRPPSRSPSATSSTSSSCTCNSIRLRSPSATRARCTPSIATLMMSAALPWIGALSAIRSAISRRCRLSLVRSGR